MSGLPSCAFKPNRSFTRPAELNRLSERLRVKFSAKRTLHKSSMVPWLSQFTRVLGAWVFTWGCTLAAQVSTPTLSIVLEEDAGTPLRIAAVELRDRLQRLYPEERIEVASSASTNRRTIRLTRARPELHLAPESFSITHAIAPQSALATIQGADEAGLCHAIYALLEKLGYGFFLSNETEPAPRPGKVSFDDWTISDRPLFADRIVQPWHNFLSGPTTWEFEDWRRYIDAVARMGFNDLMVHAYGNNPMFTFSFNGIAKPVGYFATTQRGRDWGTQHVNDVRHMIGGEIFSDAVFGASVAQVDPKKTVETTTALMRRVFAYARDRGLGVTFALDVDTLSANPQEIIRSLPPSARFTTAGIELANPDTSEGGAYYRAQCEQLLALYPSITRLVVWFRSPESNTPWRRLQRAELPEAWQREFHGDDADVSAFALARVVHAFRRALTEANRSDISLAAGSWAFPFLEASDRYLDPTIPLIALDWWVSFDSARAQRDLRHVHSGRKVIPILWAHHDDRTYVGRPYTPWVDVATKLERARASGFGIVHWTTRPLDLYFTGTIAQTWAASKDQPLEATCDAMAVCLFGESAGALGGQYLFTWVTEASMFGRETTDRFIDYPLPNPEVNLRLTRERLATLEKIAPKVSGAANAANLRYFQNYERFILSFLENQTAAELAADALKHGDRIGAREAISRVDPIRVIQDYVAAAGVGEMTRGEQALLVSLNLRWLPQILSLRQALGLEPARYRLGTVQQEPLAQGAYPNTFYFDDAHQLWKVIDRASLPETLQLGAISGEKLSPGRYHVTGIGEVEAHEGRVEIPRSAVQEEIVITPAALTKRGE